MNNESAKQNGIQDSTVVRRADRVDDQCARESWQINGDEPRDHGQNRPESPHGRSISNTTVRSHISRVAKQAPQEVLRPVPEEVLNCTQPVKLDRQKFFESLKNAPRASSPGPGGCTYEHLRTLGPCCHHRASVRGVHESGASHFAKRDLSRVDVRKVDSPHQTGWWSQGCCDKVHPEAVGGKNICQAIHEGIRACAPYQFALSTRAGTDCSCLNRRKRHSPSSVTGSGHMITHCELPC